MTNEYKIMHYLHTTYEKVYMSGSGRFLGLTKVYRLVGRLGCNSKGYCYYYIVDLATSTFLLLALDRRSCPITQLANFVNTRSPIFLHQLLLVQDRRSCPSNILFLSARSPILSYHSASKFC